MSCVASVSGARRWTAIAAVLVLSTAASAALETARMRLPDDFSADAEFLRFEGFGGRNAGGYTILDYSGRFRREESRLGIFDPLYVSNKGSSSFSFRQSGHGVDLEAECAMRRNSTTVGIVTYDPKKLHYHCDFTRGGQAVEIRLDLGEPRPVSLKERFLARNLRRGDASIGERRYTIESVHRFAGTSLSSQPPVGYVVAAEGRPVAALELTDWDPGAYLDPGLAIDVREDVLIMMLALAVLRDPAHSALEDQADLD